MRFQFLFFFMHNYFKMVHKDAEREDDEPNNFFTIKFINDALAQ